MTLINFLIKKIKIIWEAKELYIFLLILVFIFVLCSVNMGNNFPVTFRLQLFGLALQLLGTIQVVFSINNKLKIYKGTSLKEFFKDYSHRLFGKTELKNYVLKAKSGNFQLKGNNVEMYTSPNADIKEVVSYINERLTTFKNRMNNTYDEMFTKILNLEDYVRRREKSMNAEIEKSKRNLIESNISDIWGDLFAIAILILGTILSTIPNVISGLF